MSTPKNLTKGQLAAVKLARARLDPTSPAFRGSEEVAAAFSGDAKLFLQSWVFPLLDMLIEGEQYHGQMRDAQVEWHTGHTANTPESQQFLRDIRTREGW